MSKTIVAGLSNKLQQWGLDIVHPLQLDWYNSCLPDSLRAHRIPADLRSGVGGKALVVLVGNTRAAWEPFLRWLQLDSTGTPTNPFDSYVETSITTALRSLETSSYRVYWSNSKALLEGGEGYLAIQRMAECASLAHLDTTTHLCVHHKYGTWFALRCAVVFDSALFDEPAPEKLPAQTEEKEREVVNKAVAAALGTGETTGPETETWRKWLAVRDSLSPSHPFRYSEAQIRYHYTQDASALIQPLPAFAKNVNPDTSAAPRLL